MRVRDSGPEGERPASDLGSGWRRPPATPYRPTDAVLTVPYRAMELTLGVFATYASRHLESGCFWYGDRLDAGGGIVRAVVVPEQINTWGNYSVTADAMDAVAGATRVYGWRNLAQIHTHPSGSVEHSPYDDEHANSRRALSLVFPFYGRRRIADLSSVGIHEWQSDYWHLLSRDASSSRVAVVNFGEVMLIDTRHSDTSPRGAGDNPRR